MTEYQPLDYRLRCHTKRADLPPDVLRDIGEAYMEQTNLVEQNKMLSEEIVRLKHELNLVKREFCIVATADDLLTTPEEYAKRRGWYVFPWPDTPRWPVTQ